MVFTCFESEFPTIWVSVTEGGFCTAGFFLAVTFFLSLLDFVDDVVLLLSPVLPTGDESFVLFSSSPSCQIHTT